MLPAPAIQTTVSYSLPRWQAYGGCDTILISCPEESLEAVTPCDTSIVLIPETRLKLVRIYYAERWAPAPRLLREKLVGGREGQTDTLDLPSDTIATVWVAPVDSAGNEACLSDPVTVNLPPVSVDDPDPEDCQKVEWFDVSGRRIRGPPNSSGIFWRRRWCDGRALTERVVILR